MKFSPIVLFAYNRPDHLQRTIDSLKLNAEAPESALIVYSDAAKKPAAQDAVDAVRRVIAGIHGFQSVKVVERSQNFGLAKSIIEGVGEVIREYGRVIVLEDDMETSPHFLQFMNQALNKYENVSQVGCIHGYVYPVKPPLAQNIFIYGADCWGWATWERAWKNFEPDGKVLLERLFKSGRRHEFDFYSTYPFTEMLEDQINGYNQSWAIRWQASLFLRNQLILYPRTSLLRNIGFDQTGEHCDNTDIFDVQITCEALPVTDIPIEETPGAREKFAEFFRTFPRSWKG